MAENLIVNKGNKARLNEIPILAGAITAIIDARELYIDYGDDNPEYRVKITDVEVIDADSKDLSSNKVGVNPVPNPIADKLYCFTKSQDIWTYLDTNKTWTKVGGTKNSAFTLTTGMLTDEANISASSLVDMSGTKVNLSEVSVGSLIVDGNYSVGIVKAINGSTVAVKRLVDNKKTNTLTQHIYIDSAYDGTEVGTIEKPFKSFANLIAAKSDYLSSNDKKVIHLISDNCSINATTAINNCEFISESYSFEHEFNLTGNNINLTLSNCTITDYFNVKANKVCLNNCNLKSARGEEAKIKTNLLKALNIHSELSEPLKLYSYDNTDAEFNFYNSNIAEVQLSDAAITTVNFNDSKVSLSQASGITYKYNLNLTNTEVYYLRNLTTTGNIYFYSGALRSETNQPTIKATDIYLGAFDFGLLVPIFNGNIIKQSGITSKQVFDTKVRTYGNNDVNLEAHLDAIDNKFKDIDSELHGGSESDVNLGEAFISANTFDSPEVLLNASYRTGDVVKYTGYGTAELTNEFVLTVSDDENAIEQINVTNVGEDGLTTSIPHTSVKFDMENSKFFAKLFDTISVRYNSTIDDENPALGNTYSMFIYSIGPNWIKARIDNTELFDTFDNKRYFTACNYIQTIEVGPSDRILRLSNGWDKLSASNGESGNYHIVQAFNDLYGIETEDTRKVGTLAYVQDDELMYIWKVVNAETGAKDWEEWSGSELDADLLDGKHASDFVLVANLIDHLKPYKGYDYVVASQSDFDAMIADEAWFGAESILFLCDVRASDDAFNQKAITIPDFVKYIEGLYHTISYCSGFGYESVPDPSDTSNLKGIRNLRIYNSTVSGSQAYGFKNCINLYGCEVSLASPCSSIICFDNCNNLTNCYGWVQTGNSASYSDVNIKIFNKCSNLTHCTCQNNFANKRTAGYYVFYECTNLNDCICYQRTNNYGYSVFYKCDYLYGCKIAQRYTNSMHSFVVGFEQCTNLTKCSSDTAGTAATYKECKVLIDCEGTDSLVDCEKVFKSSQVLHSITGGTTDKPTIINEQTDLPCIIKDGYSAFVNPETGTVLKKYYPHEPIIVLGFDTMLVSTDGDLFSEYANPVGSFMVLSGDSTEIQYYKIDTQSDTLEITGYFEKLLERDGTESKLDSDLLDGKHASDFAQTNSTVYTDFNSVPLIVGMYGVNGTASNSPISSTGTYTVIVTKTSTGYMMLAINTVDNKIYRRHTTGAWSISTAWVNVGGGTGLQKATAIFVTSAGVEDSTSNYLKVTREEPSSELKAGDIIAVTIDNLSSSALTYSYLYSVDSLSFNKQIYKPNGSTQVQPVQIPKYFLLEYNGSTFNIVSPLSESNFVISENEPSDTSNHPTGTVWFRYYFDN